MRKFRAMVAFAGLVAGGTYLAYRYVLTDQDRASLTSAFESARGLYEEVASRVGSLANTMDVVQDTGNLDETMRQWERLGY